MGYLKIVNESLVWDISQWKQKFHKALIVTEYGADAIAGLSRVSFLSESSLVPSLFSSQATTSLSSIRWTSSRRRIGRSMLSARKGNWPAR